MTPAPHGPLHVAGRGLPDGEPVEWWIHDGTLSAEELSGRTAPAHLIRLIAEEHGGGLQYALTDGALVMGAVLPDA